MLFEKVEVEVEVEAVESEKMYCVPGLGWAGCIACTHLISIFHRPSCCISSGRSPPLLAIVAAPRLNECPKNVPLIPRLLSPDV